MHVLIYRVTVSVEKTIGKSCRVITPQDDIIYCSDIGHIDHSVAVSVEIGDEFWIYFPKNNTVEHRDIGYIDNVVVVNVGSVFDILARIDMWNEVPRRYSMVVVNCASRHIDFAM